MGPDCTLYAAAQDPGTASNDRPTRRHQRHPLPVAQRLSVATATQGLPTALDRPTLLRPLARQRFVGAHQSPTPDDCPCGRRTKRQPLGRHYRLSISQDHRKRRPTGFRCWQERSRGASVISSPILAACWSPRRSMAPMSRTVTARLSCWPLCAARFRDYVMSSPIRPIQAPSWRRRSNRLAAGGWKLSSDRLMRTPLKSCRGAGWLNELWLG